MAEGFDNQVTYSTSSAKILATCPRQYYYLRYLMWGGWWNGKRPPTSPRAEEAYVAKFAEAAYVLHAFEKQTRRAPKADLELVRQRLRALTNQRARRKG